ncbi:isochorismatase family protein [Actinidia rufa]|uniref:Isochorismatase family protein n=1 Tax=Actinidia rufa TaxID=165716 RepID=A0A7J0GM03_9ERIC|nr:isochorismatase family protein [Actinidia rufa]
MASTLRSNLALISLHPSKAKQISNTPRTLIPIRCGPRDNRGPLIKGRILSTETIQTVQSLKRAHRGDPYKLADLLSKTLPRLIKSDLVAAFNELLRQDHCDLALKVFSAVRSEYWYKTDLGVYADLVSALARKGMTEDIDPERTESSVRIYGMMKKSEWGTTSVADEYVAKVLSSGLRRLGEERHADEIDVKFGKSFRDGSSSSDNKWNSTALLVIDMQNDFILPDGLMRVDGGQAIVPNVIKAVEVARQRGILIIWVVREHDLHGRDVELFRRHLYTGEKAGPTSKGSLGAEMVDGLVIKEGDYKVAKTRFSAFFAMHLDSFLKTAGINSLVVVGVQTPNCIRQTVFDAVASDYKYVTVIVDATAAATPDIHVAYQAAFEQLSHRVHGVPEPYLKGCFIADLRDDIRLDIKIKQPCTLAETIGVARLIEERNSLHKRGITHSPVPVIPPEQPPPPEPDPIEPLLSPNRSQKYPTMP